ncbi:zinc-dependent alcohol dehydrogenase [Cohnella silvisoli]|uniref:Alcohol dehydrogenase catalytic domain-containing protein n=1 Tax=Cohnella silvisoli TaxID=2873699 RepID=A0ABV1L0W7_9BACL|nr:alcohol dehydrogenase catalytic domain-containing protein [Cohnella silvisoli]MCD9024871.1 alcohol dehydrogenase catalytic domain-containing protein [Cohnella silvisoli]
MKAAYIKAPMQVEIRETVLPLLGEDEVLIRVMACGICGTDVTSITSGALDWEPAGHEIAGIVEQVGTRVTNTTAGERVTLETGTYSRYSEDSRNGRYDLCNKGPNFWLKGPMGFAEYIIAPKECAVPYTDLSFEEATLVEPLGVAMDLFRTAEIGLGDDVLVIGLGPIGLMALRLAKLAGARKIYAAARSHSARRIELAKQFGADEIILTDQAELDSFPYDKGGVNRVLVTAPPSSIPAAIKAARVGGIIGYIGIAYGDAAAVAFDGNEFHFKKLQLRASHASPALFFPQCIELLKSGAIEGKALISHTFKLDQLEEAFMSLTANKSEAVKLVMVHDGASPTLGGDEYAS